MMLIETVHVLKYLMIVVHLPSGDPTLLSWIGVNVLQYGVNLQRQEYFADSIAAGTAKEKTGDWFCWQ